VLMSASMVRFASTHRNKRPHCGAYPPAEEVTTVVVFNDDVVVDSSSQGGAGSYALCCAT
jgi:hypothetical protein